MIIEARWNALRISNIRAAFRCTGIAPFNRRRVLNNPDLQNLTPLHQTHHNLHPLSTSDSPTSQISQLEPELEGATSVQQARELGIELASLAKTASAQSALHGKRFQDELKKRKARKANAGSIITLAEIVGRKALDKAYKEKLARKEKAKKVAESKRKMQEKQQQRSKKHDREEEEEEESELSGSEKGQSSGENGPRGSIGERVAGGIICSSNQALHNPVDATQPFQPVGETLENQRRNPARAARTNPSFTRLFLCELNEDEE